MTPLVGGSKIHEALSTGGTWLKIFAWVIWFLHGVTCWSRMGGICRDERTPHRAALTTSDSDETDQGSLFLFLITRERFRHISALFSSNRQLLSQSLLLQLSSRDVNCEHCIEAFLVALSCSLVPRLAHQVGRGTWLIVTLCFTGREKRAHKVASTWWSVS